MGTFVDDLYNYLQKKRKSGHKLYGYGVPNWSKEDVTKLGSIASSFGFPPQWLANLINFESGGTFNPAIKNPSSGATGLIQFMPQYFNTTLFKRMSVSTQLDEVKKYLTNFFKRKNASKVYDKTKGKVKDNFTQTDLFMIIFYPASVGNPYYLFPLKVVVANNGITTPKAYTSKAIKDTSPFKDFPHNLIPTDPIDYVEKPMPNIYKFLIILGISYIGYQMYKRISKGMGNAPVSLTKIKF